MIKIGKRSLSLIKFILSTFQSMPYFWASLVIALLMIECVIRIKNDKARLVIANLFTIPLLICVVEVVCLRINTAYYSNMAVNNNPPSFFNPSDTLGYAAEKNTKAHFIRVGGDKKKIYDVYYTTDKNGLREIPSSNSNSDKCLLFFGDSFMFGEGLNDNETLPYYVGEKTHNKYKIYNFGFMGYGPNQMLSAIEHGVVDEAVSKCSTNTAFYSSVPDHLNRIEGRRFWERNDPKYELSGNKLIYQGHFGDYEKHIPEGLMTILRKSQTFVYANRLFIQKRMQLSLNEYIKYRKLYLALVFKSESILKEKYNVDRFVNLLWNWNDPYLQNALDKNYSEYYQVNSILLNYDEDYSKFLIKGDDHPNKLANEILAEFLVKQLKLN